MSRIALALAGCLCASLPGDPASAARSGRWLLGVSPSVSYLVINGVSQPVEFAIEAQLTGDLIVVVGNTSVTFSDFDVEVPSAPIVAT